MYRDEQLASSLAKLLASFDYAMIDTCSMMEDAFPLWLDILELSKPYQLGSKSQVIVLSTALTELKKHAKSKIADKAIAAKRALKIIKTAAKKKTISIVKLKWANQDFLDHAIYVKASSDRLDSKILVITQDKKFATDLLNLNELQSQFGYKISVDKINPDGTLSPNKGEAVPTHRGEKEKTHNHSSPKGPDIFLADARLASVIGNPNYPLERKLNDAKAQLKAISSLSKKDKAAIKLNYPEARLQDFIASHPLSKVEAKPEPKPSPKKEEKAKPQKEAPKSLPKPVEAKPLPKPSPFAIDSQSVSALLLERGIIVRDAGVPYIPTVHGEVDINKKELDGIVAKANKNGKNGDKTPIKFKNMTLFPSSKVSIQIDLNLLKEDQKKIAKVAPEVKVESKPAPAMKKNEEAKDKPAPKKEEKPKPQKEAPKPSTPKKEEKPSTKAKAEAKKEEPKPSLKKEAPKPAKKKNDEPKPEPKKEPVLIVAIPEEGSKKAKSQPKKKSESKTNKEAKSTKKENKPSPKKEKAVTPVKEEKPPVDMAKVKSDEARLMAILPNPTYPKDKKIVEAKAHLRVISQLKKAEKSQLKLDDKTLKDEITKLKEAKE